MKTILINSLFVPQVRIGAWTLEQESLDQISDERQKNIEFLIEYKTRVRKLKFIFLGLSPFLLLFCYAIFAIVIFSIHPRSFSNYFLFGVLILFILNIVTGVVYAFCKIKYLNWEDYRKRLWLISKNEGLEKIYMHCEMKERTAQLLPLPSIPVFPSGIQKKLNRLIYFHFHEYVPSSDESKPRRIESSFDGHRRKALEEESIK